MVQSLRLKYQKRRILKMYTAKQLIVYTKKLNVLYVEDDDKLREEMSSLFKLFFKEIDTACDGVEGLEKYNNSSFDIVITDINMPHMNGIEMITHIKEINPEQKIVAVSAHNESDILIQLIKAGISSFILKPILQNEVINTLYPVSRDAYTQVLNLELVHELNGKQNELEKKLKELQAKNNTIDTKHTQLETLLQEKASNNRDNETSILSAYFEKDEDEGEQNILFMREDADDMMEYFHEITEHLTLTIIHSSAENIVKISDMFSKISSILLHYSPYLDTLAASFTELSIALREHIQEFITVLKQDSDGILKLFDAVNSDMERYIQRFSIESIAMKNSHHIHEPTTLSIRQIVTLFLPDQFGDGDIEFF